MKKRFYIIDKQACVVTWRFPVDAETEAEALEKYANGEFGVPEDPEIGDSIEAIQYDLEVES